MNEALVQELCGRGIDHPFAVKLVGEHAADRVEAAVAFFDGLRGAGPGLLVTAIRQGKRPAGRRDLVGEQREYAEQVVGWLRKNFPEFDRPVWGPHPAAVAEVFRLHGRFGRGRLTRAEHGSLIRAAVKVWEERWES